MSTNPLESLITLLEQEVEILLQQNLSLKKENALLKKQLADKPTPAQSDLFGNLSTTEKMALKAKVDHLIHKIDIHLGK
jgi:cell division septum initiation protein DivIVA